MKIFALAACIMAVTIDASAQGIAFTYQGWRNDGANPASGRYGLRREAQGHVAFARATKHD